MHPIFHEMLPRNPLIPKTIDHAEDSMDVATIDIGGTGSLLCGLQQFSSKPIESWTVDDISNWLIVESEKLGVDYIQLRGEKFARISGAELAKMAEGEFRDITPDFGEHLYHSIQRVSTESSLRMLSYAGEGDVESFKDEGRSLVDLDSIRPSQGSYIAERNNGHSDPSLDSQKSKKLEAATVGPDFVPRRQRGRPKNPNKANKKKQETFGRLWEFLRELLKNPEFCPGMIRWENHDEGMFRFVQSDKVAKIWGTRKGNKEMSYEKLSRAMRYYYKSRVLEPVIGRRLVYKFGPKATGWRVDDPNFEKASRREAS